MIDAVLPPSIRRIGRGAFRGCRELQTIAMPATEVEPTAFEGCRSLDCIAFIEGNSLSAYSGRIVSRESAECVRETSRNGQPLPRKESCRIGCGIKVFPSLLDYVDIDGTKRAGLLETMSAGSEQETVDAIAIMACLSPPSEEDGAAADLVRMHGSPFSRAMCLACGVGGEPDIGGAKKIMESGPCGRLYRNLSEDPFMARLRGIVGDGSFADAAEAWKSSGDLSERIASLCAARACLSGDIGIDRMAEAISLCEGCEELGFAVYDRIAPVLGAIMGCSSADFSDRQT